MVLLQPVYSSCSYSSELQVVWVTLNTTLNVEKMQLLTGEQLCDVTVPKQRKCCCSAVVRAIHLVLHVI